MDNRTTQNISSHLVMVMGMHRSGTSAASQLLNRLGLYFGNNFIKKIDGINTDGFWEDKTLVSINERILEVLDSSWYSFQPLPVNWWTVPELDECYLAAAQWFDQDIAGQASAGFKDPRLCRLLPFWLHFFRQRHIEPALVFIYRHPYSVAASLKKRDGFGLDVSCLLWLAYTLDALAYMPDNALSLVCYEKLLDRSVETTKSLLGGGLKAIPSLKRLRFARVAVATIDREKNHNDLATCGNENQTSVYAGLAAELYKELNTATPDNLATLAKIYRERFNAIADNTKLLAILQEEVNCHVAAHRQLSALGAEHTHALNTLAKKDNIYERSLADAEKRISGNKTYIRKCQARIREQDALMKTLGKKSELVENLQRALADREKKLALNNAYIQKCHTRINEQDEMIVQLKNATFFWPIFYVGKKIIRRMIGRPRG